MSTSILKALPGKLDIKRDPPSILFLNNDLVLDSFYYFVKLRAMFSAKILKKKTIIENESMEQFQCVPTTYVTENKPTYFEICTYQVTCPLFLSL